MNIDSFKFHCKTACTASCFVLQPGITVLQPLLFLCMFCTVSGCGALSPILYIITEQYPTNHSRDLDLEVEYTLSELGYYAGGKRYLDIKYRKESPGMKEIFFTISVHVLVTGGSLT